MRKIVILTSFLYVVLQVFAQTTLTVYQDCSKSGIIINNAIIGSENGHQWVDLELPSGTKWATCNVGASKPSIIGSYYSWGETTNKSNYVLTSYSYYKNSMYQFIGQNISNTKYDAAHVHWGGRWRLPTKEEATELLSCCSKIYTDSGYMYLGKHEQSIFIPKSGYMQWDQIQSGSAPLSWTSTYYPEAYSDSPAGSGAYALFCSEKNVRYMARRFGLPIRPVFDGEISAIRLIVKSNECDSVNECICFSPTTIIMKAIALPNNHFLKWNDGNTSNPRTITINENATYTAEFAPNECKITTSTTNGKVTGAGTYNYNTNVTLIATPNEHYHFIKWSDGNTSNPRTITATKDSTYTAVFALDQFSITATGEHGTVTGSGTYNYGATATLTATNSDCYSFQKWSDGNTDNPRSVVVTQDSTFTAIFVGTGYQETVNCTVVNESPYGTVSFTGEVIKDSNISLKATAPECSKFVRWSDNDTSNPRSLTVTQDSTLTAIFEKIQFNVSIDTNDPKKGKVKIE